MRENIARIQDDFEQTVEEHLLETAKLAEQFASKINLNKIGYLAGLLHDLGKCSDEFYDRIKNKGPICDHATAGAEYVITLFKDLEINHKEILLSVFQFLIMSHHGGLIDEVDKDGKTERAERLQKYVGLENVLYYADKQILNDAKEICQNKLNAEFKNVITQIYEQYRTNKMAFYFNISLLIKFLFSCLVDADRKNTIKFNNQAKQKAKKLK